MSFRVHFSYQIPILRFSLSVDRLPWETTHTLLWEAFGSVANKEISAHNPGAEPHERHAQSVCVFNVFTEHYSLTLTCQALFFMLGTIIGLFNSVQWLSRVWIFATPWTAARQASLSITNSRSPPRPMSIEWMMPSNHFILGRPLLLLLSIFSSIRDFSSELALHMRWPKYWRLSLNISPSSEHPGLISFRMDWLDLLAVQGYLKSLLQHHS